MINQPGGADIEHLVVDRDANPPLLLAGRSKPAEGQVLDRKVAVLKVGGRHLAPQSPIVRRVDSGDALRDVVDPVDLEHRFMPPLRPARRG